MDDNNLKNNLIVLDRYRQSKNESKEFSEFLQSVFLLKSRDLKDESTEDSVELVIDHGVDFIDDTPN